MRLSEINNRPVRLPSWLLSVALHLILLVLLGLLVRAPMQMVSAQPDRPVGIVLAQHDLETTQYFDETDGVDQDSASPTSDPAASVDTQAQLPDADHEPHLQTPDLALPQSPTLPVPNEGLFPRPDLSGGGKVRMLPNQGVSDVLDEDARIRRRNRPLGPSTRVSVFGSAEAEGRTFIFVIDRSQSMGGAGLGALRVASREFERALSALQPVHKFQILAYNHERVFFGDEPFVPATEENKNRIGMFMRGLAAFGGTDHYLGLSSALYRDPDVIFLLTDGGDPPLSPAQLVKIRRRAAGRTTIHCILFGDRAAQNGEHFLQQVAQENGGSFRYVDLRRYRQP